MAATISRLTEDRYIESKLELLSQDYPSIAKQREEFITKKAIEIMMVTKRAFGAKIGHELPAELFPKDLIFVRGHEMFDYNHCLGGLVVTRDFKECVEEVEPGVHRFLPVDIYNADRTPHAKGPFWYFDIRNFVDAIDPSTGAVKTIGTDAMDNPSRHWAVVPGRQKDLAVRHNVIEGMAAWLDIRHSSVRFFSDALLQKLEDRKLDGYRCDLHWAEI